MKLLRKLFVLLIFSLFAGPVAASDVMVIGGIPWPGGKAQIFLSNGTYVRYDIANDRVEKGYPKPVTDKTWPGLGRYGDFLSAVCLGPAGKAYFFTGDGLYLRYDIAGDRVDPGYPKRVDDRTWPGLGREATRIQGAMNWPGNKIQFFLGGGRYARYDLASNRVEQGYPKAVNDQTWPGLGAHARSLSGVVNWTGGKSYLFLANGRYLRYDIGQDRVDAGYPKAVNEKTWPGLGLATGQGMP
jgi:hypothetical protein